MSAACEYFVASACEVGALDPTRSPSAQLPDATAVRLPGTDPDVVLTSLIEVLCPDGDTALWAGADDRATDPADAGAPGATAVDRLVVAAIQGADGDPELEWDDVVAQWSRRVESRVGPVDVTELARVADRLRLLGGQLGADPTRRLYRWNAS